MQLRWLNGIPKRRFLFAWENTLKLVKDEWISCRICMLMESNSINLSMFLWLHLCSRPGNGNRKQNSSSKTKFLIYFKSNFISNKSLRHSQKKNKVSNHFFPITVLFSIIFAWLFVPIYVHIELWGEQRNFICQFNAETGFPLLLSHLPLLWCFIAKKSMINLSCFVGRARFWRETRDIASEFNL